MSANFNIDAADARTHALTLAKIITRSTAVVLCLIISACTLRCSPDQQLASAKRDSVYWKGIAEECRRHD